LLMALLPPRSHITYLLCGISRLHHSTGDLAKMRPLAWVTEVVATIEGKLCPGRDVPSLFELSDIVCGGRCCQPVSPCSAPAWPAERRSPFTPAARPAGQTNAIWAPYAYRFDGFAASVPGPPTSHMHLPASFEVFALRFPPSGTASLIITVGTEGAERVPTSLRRRTWP